MDLACTRMKLCYGVSVLRFQFHDRVPKNPHPMDGDSSTNVHPREANTTKVSSAAIPRESFFRPNSCSFLRHILATRDFSKLRVVHPREHPPFAPRRKPRSIRRFPRSETSRLDEPTSHFAASERVFAEVRDTRRMLASATLAADRDSRDTPWNLRGGVARRPPDPAGLSTRDRPSVDPLSLPLSLSRCLDYYTIKMWRPVGTALNYKGWSVDRFNWSGPNVATPLLWVDAWGEIFERRHAGENMVMRSGWNILWRIFRRDDGRGLLSRRVTHRFGRVGVWSKVFLSEGRG